MRTSLFDDPDPDDTDGDDEHDIMPPDDGDDVDGDLDAYEEIPEGDAVEPEPDDDQDAEPEPDPEPDSEEGEDAALMEAEGIAPGVRNGRVVRLSSLRLEYKDWRNPRFQSGLSSEALRPLADSILEATTSNGSDVVAGVKDKLLVLHVLDNGEEINVVIDGQRRSLAMELAYLKGRKIGVKGAGDDVLVPVDDFEPGPVTWTKEIAAKLLVRALETTATREGLSAFELSVNAEKLRGLRNPDTGKDYTLAQIAQVLGRSESWVSKILSAREAAKPQILHLWETGKITEEQFKDLAAMPAKEQSKAAGAVAEARASGDKAGARAVAKEQKAIAAAKADPAKADGKPTKSALRGRPVVSGEQQQFPPTPPLKPPPVAVMEDLLDMAAKRPPTHDYVKGFMDGVRWDRGKIDAADYGKPLVAYLQRVDGKKPKAAKAAAKPKKKGKPKK